MNKIPKIIHYCWFGGKTLPKQAKKCIESWKKFCPDYKIIEWNEKNFNIHCCKYVEEAYEAQKWAFVSDYARFLGLFKMGGIYFDTDIEVLKSFDSLLDNAAFFGFGRTSLTLPVFGAEKECACIKDIIDDYSKRSFIKKDGTYDTTTIEFTAQKILCEKYNLIMNGVKQHLPTDIVIYPKQYFSSTDWSTGIITKNPELFVIHYAEGTWMTDEQKKQYAIRKKSIKVFGKKLGMFVGDILFVIWKEGAKGFFSHGRNYIQRMLTPIVMKCISRIYCKRNKIVFENFAGKGYGDNPKYIADEIIRQDLNYDMVWIVSSKSSFSFPKQVRTVKTGSFAEIFELATAKFWIDNNRKFGNLYKGEKQKYIQTWHGFYPLKKMEKDAEESLTQGYVEAAKRDGKMTDLMISGCAVRTELYHKSFWYEGEILDCGTPRNDIFFKENDCRKKVRQYLNLDLHRYIVLYAPTFRDDHSIVAYDLDYDRLLAGLAHRFGGSWTCLIKLHPAVREKSKEMKLGENCIDVSSYEDIQELFCAADFLITDYSDCMFEFSLTRKPVLIYASDLDEYIADRDFYYDIHELPYDIVLNNNELEVAIKDMNLYEYEKRINEFFDRIGCYETGNASKTVVNYIVKNT